MGNIDSSNKLSNARRSNTSKESEQGQNNQRNNMNSNNNNSSNYNIDNLKKNRARSIIDLTKTKIQRSRLLNNIDSLKIVQIASKITNKVLAGNLDLNPANLLNSSCVPNTSKNNKNFDLNKEIIKNLNSSLNSIILAEKFSEGKANDIGKNRINDRVYFTDTIRNNKNIGTLIGNNIEKKNKEELNSLVEDKNNKINELIKDKIERMLKETESVNLNLASDKSSSELNSQKKEYGSAVSSKLSSQLQNEKLKDKQKREKEKENYSNSKEKNLKKKETNIKINKDLSSRNKSKNHNKMDDSVFETSNENRKINESHQVDNKNALKLDLSRTNFNLEKTNPKGINKSNMESLTPRSKSPVGKFEMMKNYNKSKVTGFFKNTRENSNNASGNDSGWNSPKSSERKVNQKIQNKNIKEVHLKIKINASNRSPDARKREHSNPKGNQNHHKIKNNESYFEETTKKDLNSEKVKKIDLTKYEKSPLKSVSKSPTSKYIPLKNKKNETNMSHLYLNTEVIEYKPEKFNPDSRILKTDRNEIDRNNSNSKENYHNYYTERNEYDHRINHKETSVNYGYTERGNEKGIHIDYSRMNKNIPETTVKAKKITYAELMLKKTQPSNKSINTSINNPNNTSVNNIQNTSTHMIQLSPSSNNHKSVFSQNKSIIDVEGSSADLIKKKLEKNKHRKESGMESALNSKNNSRNNSHRNSLIKKQDKRNSSKNSNIPIGNNSKINIPNMKKKPNTSYYESNYETNPNQSNFSNKTSENKHINQNFREEKSRNLKDIVPREHYNTTLKETEYEDLQDNYNTYSNTKVDRINRDELKTDRIEYIKGDRKNIREFSREQSENYSRDEEDFHRVNKEIELERDKINKKIEKKEREGKDLDKNRKNKENLNIDENYQIFERNEINYKKNNISKMNKEDIEIIEQKPIESNKEKLQRLKNLKLDINDIKKKSSEEFIRNSSKDKNRSNDQLGLKRSKSNESNEYDYHSDNSPNKYDNSENDINLNRKNTPVLGMKSSSRGKNGHKNSNSFGNIISEIKNDYKDEMLKDFNPNNLRESEEVAGEKFSFRNNIQEQAERNHLKKIKDDKKIFGNNYSNSNSNSKNNSRDRINESFGENQNYTSNQSFIHKNTENFRGSGGNGIKIIKPKMKNYDNSDTKQINLSFDEDKKIYKNKMKGEKAVFKINISDLENEIESDDWTDRNKSKDKRKNIDYDYNEKTQNYKDKYNDEEIYKKDKSNKYRPDSKSSDTLKTERSTNYSPNTNEYVNSFAKENNKRKNNNEEEMHNYISKINKERKQKN